MFARKEEGRGAGRIETYHKWVIKKQQLLKSLLRIQLKNGSAPRWVVAQVLQGPYGTNSHGWHTWPMKIAQVETQTMRKMARLRL